MHRLDGVELHDAQGVETEQALRRPDFALSSETPGGYVGQATRLRRVSRDSNAIVGSELVNVSNDGKSWAVSGSRLLQTDRTATLQSGSPPGLGRATRVH